MKSIFKIAVLFIAFNTWPLIFPQKATAQISINLQVFYDDLSPYGSWVLNDHYGYVWIPDVAVGFIPYGTNGHWIYTNVGWTWVSNYSWGWAPFHYGRWYYDYIYGWIWVPAYEWGPAWVIWRRCEGYYGWAPIGPGISISVAYGGNYNLPSNQWILVRDQDLGRTNINNYYVRTSDNSRILKNSTIINNIRTDNSNKVKYGIGPNKNEIEKRTGKAIRPVEIRERNKPGHNSNKDELYIYKPRVERYTASGEKPIPYKVVHMKDVRPNNRSNTLGQPNDQQVKKQTNNQNKEKNRGYDQSVSKSNKQNQGQYPQQSNHGNQQPQRNDQSVPKPNKQNQELNPGYQQPQRKEQSVPQQHNNKQYQPQYPQESNRGNQQPQRDKQSAPQPQNNRQYQPQYPQESNHGQQSVSQQQRSEQSAPPPQSHQNNPKKQ